MKCEFPYKAGDIVPVFNNWETEDTQIGTAKLVDFHRFGRSFILEDTYPEADQIVYNFQEWWVQLDCPQCDLPYKIKIRYVDTFGIANSEDDDDYDPETDPKLAKDKFLTYDGKEIY